MLLSQRIRELIYAAFTGLWIQTVEPDEAIQEIRQLADQEGYELLIEEPGPMMDPYGVVNGLIEADYGDKTAVLCLPNYTIYLQNDPVIKQIVYRAIQS